MLAILETLQEEFRGFLALTEKSTPRAYKFPEAKNIIKVAVGMRRSGKTYFLFQTIRQLLADGLPLDRVLYVNFEDDPCLQRKKNSVFLEDSSTTQATSAIRWCS